MLTPFGLGGRVIALAFKDPPASFFAGLHILGDPP
jgi:hypothetical protein